MMTMMIMIMIMILMMTMMMIMILMMTMMMIMIMMMTMMSSFPLYLPVCMHIKAFNTVVYYMP